MTLRSHAWLSTGAEVLAARLTATPDDRPHCDVLVVGSGYGGAVAAAHLAGARDAQGRELDVWLLERGAEHLPGRFPSHFSELPGFVRFSRQDGAPARGRAEGLFDVRIGGDVSVLLGNGLGGGSLINAGVMAEPDATVFDTGWPAVITAKAMRPFYSEALTRIGVQQAPANLRKLHMLRRLVGCADDVDLRAPISVHFQAGQQSSAGVGMRPCTLCGDCLTGCNQGAKGSLDTSYLAQASQRGARLYCGAAVERLERDDANDLWRVHWHYTDPALRPPGGAAFMIRARRVILAAGSLGSTEILLRSAQALALSPRLGKGFSTNGDGIVACSGHDTPVAMAADAQTDPADISARRIGPTITGMHRVPAAEGRAPFWIEEFAVPGALRHVFGELVGLLDALDDAQAATAAAVSAQTIERMSLYGLIGDERRDDPGNAGTIVLPTPAPGAAAVEGGVRIDWPGAGGAPVYAQMREWVRQAAAHVAPARVVPGADPLSRALASALAVTVHPLGGCAMADVAQDGVVDDLGRAFRCDGHDTHYRGLAVLDGSIVPRPLGINPALTIAALAERAVAGLIASWQLTPWNGDAAPPPPRTILRRREVPAPETVWTLRERLQGLMSFNGQHHWARLEIEFDPIPGFRKALALEQRVLGVRRAQLRLRSAEQHTTEFDIDDREDDGLDVAVMQLGGQVDLFALPPAHAPGNGEDVDLRRRLVYRLAVQSVSGRTDLGIGVGDRLQGVKVFGPDPDRQPDAQRSPWRQLSEMDVALAGQPVGRWALDLGDLARRRDPLLSIARLGTMPDAIDDLAAVVLFTLRLALPWLKAIADKGDFGSARAELLDQRCPGVVDGVQPETCGANGGWRLSRYRKDDARPTPVVLVHGLGTSGSSYTDPSLHNLTRTLLADQRDVWVLDLRSSIANEAGRRLPQSQSWTVDGIGDEDIPQAIERVLGVTKAERVDVFAHCMGAVMFCLAAMGRPSLQGKVRSAVLSQVGPLARLSPLNRLRGYVGSYLRSFVAVQELDTAPEYRSAQVLDDCRSQWQPTDRGIGALLLDALLATFPYPDGEPQREFSLQKGPLSGTGFRAVRHRADAIFGQLFELYNLAPETLGRLEALFGWSKVAMLSQAIHFARHEMLTNARGHNNAIRLASLVERFDFPLLMLHGRRNRVFDWRGSRRSWRLLRRVRGEGEPAPVVCDSPSPRTVYGAGERTQLQVLARYGHLDCLLGKDAHADVFPIVTEFLARVDTADFEDPGRARRIDRRSRAPEAPWTGPVLGWMRREGERLCARVWLRATPRRARVEGLAVVPLRRTADGPQLDLAAGRGLPWPGGQGRDASIELRVQRLWIELGGTDTFALLTLHEPMPLGAALDDPRLETYADRGDAWLAHSRPLHRRVQVALRRWFCRHRADGAWERCVISLPQRTRGALDQRAVQPMGARQCLSFALASCQYPPGLFDHAPAQATWSRLLQDLQEHEQAPQFLLLAGDQVYVDTEAGVFDPGVAPSAQDALVAAEFDRHYDLNWHGASFRRVVAQLPVYPMLDDHEVGDNWPGVHGAPGHQPPHAQAARDAFLRHQRVLAPDARWHGSLGYRIFPGGVPFWVLDTRSDRDARSAAAVAQAHILREAHLDTLIDELAHASVKDSVKFIVSPVPILPPERVSALPLPERLRSDTWSGFPASTAKLLCAIRDRGIRRVVFLSGDSHLSSVTTFTFDEHAEPCIVSVVSSGTYAPWPFANQRPDELILDGAVELGVGAACAGTVRLHALAAADSYALVRLEAAGASRFVLHVSLRGDSRTTRECRIALT
jgi:choline dehydrogenase-like flavoprotein